MFARGDDARIPIFAVTGTNGKTTTTRFIAHSDAPAWPARRHDLHRRHLRRGTPHRHRRLQRTEEREARARHPRVDVAVLETARGGMLREGLGFDWCDVAVVTNVGEGDHLGMGGLHTRRISRASRRFPSGASRPAGSRCSTPTIPWCSPWRPVRRQRDPLQPRRKLGGRRTSPRCGGKAVVVKQGYVVLADGRLERRLASLAELPLTQGGRLGFQIENLLGGIGAGFGLGVPLERSASPRRRSRATSGPSRVASTCSRTATAP
jgi:cyanophycin synthetase